MTSMRPRLKELNDNPYLKMDISITNSAIVGNNSNVSQNYVDSALIHQNTLLMEQNRILMEQVRSLIRTIEKMNHDKE